MYTNICVHERERESEGVGPIKRQLDQTDKHLSRILSNAMHTHAVVEIEKARSRMHAYAALKCK